MKIRPEGAELLMRTNRQTDRQINRQTWRNKYSLFAILRKAPESGPSFCCVLCVLVLVLYEKTVQNLCIVTAVWCTLYFIFCCRSSACYNTNSVPLIFLYICTVLQRTAKLKCAHYCRFFIRPAVLLNTGWRCRVGGTPASYTGGPSFKSRHKSQLPDWHISFLSPVSSWNVRVSTPSSETTTSLHVRRSNSTLVLQFHCICSLYAHDLFFLLANIPVFIFISHI